MEPILGQIQAFGFNFAPRNWLKCDGQLLPINQYEALFSLLGTTYGGDGRTSFGLPDLRGRVSMHMGQGPGLPNYAIGQKGGQDEVTLTTTQMPGHSHTAHGVGETADSTKPGGNALAAPESVNIFKNQAPDAQLIGGTIGDAGGGQSHENRQPYLVINWCICIQGLYPSRN